jgi:hypothetical protein
MVVLAVKYTWKEGSGLQDWGYTREIGRGGGYSLMEEGFELPKEVHFGEMWYGLMEDGVKIHRRCTLEKRGYILMEEGVKLHRRCTLERRGCCLMERVLHFIGSALHLRRLADEIRVEAEGLLLGEVVCMASVPLCE